MQIVLPFGLGYIFGKLYDLGDYPGVIPNYKLNSKVFGKVVQLNALDWTLKILDDYEGIETNAPGSGLFRREKIDVFMENDIIPSWVYVYNHSVEGKPEIASGDYLHFLKTKP